MKWFCLIAWLLLVLNPGQTLAGPATEVDPPRRTAQEIFETCRLCHSTKEMQRGPILDGLPAWYVTLQLNKFKAGVRGTNSENRSEALMAAAISLPRDDDEIRRVAEFIGALPPQKHLKIVRGDEQRGKSLFLACVPCHGERGQGNPELKSPPLNVQEDWYLLDQLRKFKAGQRGSDPRDVEGKTMQPVMGFLETKDLRDIVRYIALELSRTNASHIPTEPTPK
jgi:cytochrome c553